MDLATQQGFAKVLNEMALKQRHIIREQYNQDINTKSVSIFDIVDVSIEDICAAEINYSGAFRREAFGFSPINDRLIFENISTDELKNICKRLKDEYGIKDWQILTQPFYNDIEGLYASFNKDIKNSEAVSLLIPVIEKNREIIVNVMRQEGYYHIGGTPVNIGSNHKVAWTSLWFVPYVQQDVRDKIKDSTWLFHVTSDINVPGIMSKGLIPKASDGIFTYQPRIYFWNEDDLERAMTYSTQMYGYALDKLGSEANPGYTIIRIDAQFIFNNLNIGVYYDPLIQDAFFIANSIPRSRISTFRHITVSGHEAEYKRTYKRDTLEYIAGINNMQYDSYSGRMISKEKNDLELLKPILDKEEILYSNNIYQDDNEYFLVVIE